MGSVREYIRKAVKLKGNDGNYGNDTPERELEYSGERRDQTPFYVLHSEERICGFEKKIMKSARRTLPSHSYCLSTEK